MGKVMIFSLPFFSHVKPTLPLVAELLARGEEVVYYSDEGYRELLQDYDVTFRSYGDMQGLFTDNDPGIYLSNPRMMLEYLVPGVIGKSKTVMNAVLPEVMADPPDYILRDCDAYWGKQIGELLDLPVACYILTFAINHRMLEKDPPFLIHNIFKIKAEHYNETVSVGELDKAAEEIAERHNIQGFSLIDAFSGNEELNLVYTSEAFQPHADTFDERFIFLGPLFPGESPVSLRRNIRKKDGGQPLIYISFGSIYTDRPEFYQKCIAAFKDSGAKVIMSVGRNMDLSIFGEPPENIEIRSFVPQLEILRDADVFISHAGYNSVCEAMVFGVPMVLLPQGADQFAIADRLEELGAGLYIRNEEITASQLKEITFETMNNEYIQLNARALGETFFGGGGAARGVDELIQYVSALSV
ncbi:macrolide family glycosyltransferase [Paenibacillus sp. sgz500958]|uniref:macrolide family glycosyltransferase n=1 Tax=Paenibacillus sp. sgz500958 TaxID=3242475 RepID=UPI0036D3B579